MQFTYLKGEEIEAVQIQLCNIPGKHAQHRGPNMFGVNIETDSWMRERTTPALLTTIEDLSMEINSLLTNSLKFFVDGSERI